MALQTLKKPNVKYYILLVFLLVISCSPARPLRPADISVPEGFTVDLAVEGLAAPTMVTFDDQGRMIIAESAYGGGGEPKVTRIEPDGTRTVLTSGQFGDELPVTAVAFNEGQVYVVHAGTVSIIQPDGSLKNIITGLPGQGDHQANQLVFQEGWMYLSIGTVTNSGVVGTDNAVFGWLKKPQNRQLHEVPCQDIILTDQVFESENPLDESQKTVKTTAYSAFGSVLPAGSTVPGNPKCNGAVLRARLDGSELEVYAWGLRNPYGLEIGPDNALYVAMHGFDARGSRPVEDAWDCFYKVNQGDWFGWPDFACEVPVTDPRFKAKDKPQPQFLIANHPTENPPQPIAKFNPHAASNGFAFAPSDQWGKPTDAYIAMFGDFTPATGTVAIPQGVEVLKLDTTTGSITTFLSNKVLGAGSTHNTGGLEHPSDVTFGPEGAMYVTDWGVANISVEGLKLVPNSGVVWKVTPGTSQTGLPGVPSFIYSLLGTLALAVVTAFTMRGRLTHFHMRNGLLMGMIAGLVMGVAAMLVSALILRLPWYAPPRVFATMVMGRAAIANILEFELVAFIVGLIVVLVLTGILGAVFAWLLRTNDNRRIILSGLLYGLTVWAILQLFILPVVFPLVAEKGFPPQWYAVAFGIYGVTLGLLFAARSRNSATVKPE